MARTHWFAGIAVSAIALCAGTALSQTWDGSESSVWNNGANWQGGSVPTSGADVIIPDAASVNHTPIFDGSGGVDNDFATLTLQSDAEMDIADGATVVITGTGDLDDDLVVASGAVLQVEDNMSTLELSDSVAIFEASVDGEIRLLSSTVMFASEDASLHGEGFIGMAGSGAVIQIQAEKTLRNDLGDGVRVTEDASIVGQLGGPFDLPGAFLNDTLVVATDDVDSVGVLTMATTTILGDGTGDWHALNDGEIVFNRTSQLLEGGFLAKDGGVIRIASNITISLTDSVNSDVHIDAGTVDLGDNATLNVEDDFTFANGGIADACDNATINVSGTSPFSGGQLQDEWWEEGNGGNPLACP